MNNPESCYCAALGERAPCSYCLRFELVDDESQNTEETPTGQYKSITSLLSAYKPNDTSQSELIRLKAHNEMLQKLLTKAVDEKLLAIKEMTAAKVEALKSISDVRDAKNRAAVIDVECQNLRREVAEIRKNLEDQIAINKRLVEDSKNRDLYLPRDTSFGQNSIRPLDID